MLKKFNMLDAKPVMNPMHTSKPLTKDENVKKVD